MKMNIDEIWSKYGLVITKSSVGKIGLDKNNFTKAIAEIIISPVEPEISDDFADKIFNQIEEYLGEKYRNWKQLKHKHYETIGYKRAYLDVKKLHRKICKQNSR